MWGKKKQISSDKIRGICFSIIEQISEAKLSLLMGSCVKDVSPGGQSRQLPQGPQALRGPECSGFTVHQHIHINLYQK